MAARTAAQIAAQKRAAAASAAKRKARTTGHDAGIKASKQAAKAELGRAAVRKATRGYAQHGPLGAKHIAEHIAAKHPVSSRQASGIHAKTHTVDHGPQSKGKSAFSKPKKKQHMTEHDKWKASWGMGGG